MNNLNLTDNENTFFSNSFFEGFEMPIGAIIKVFYKNSSDRKQNIKNCQGVLISKKNNKTNKAFTVLYSIEGTKVEMTFPIFAPNLVLIIPKNFYKVKKSKLYFLRKYVSAKKKSEAL
jgi:ribosomal protein L19